MKNIPFQIYDISKQEELFGRDELIKRLMIDLSSKQNVNIVGSRRFGKTCVLKTLFNIIKSEDKLSVFPVFLDFKSDDIHGTLSSYRYMIGQFVAELYNVNLFTQSEKFGSIEISPDSDWSEIDEQLNNISISRIQKLLEKLIYYFSSLMDKTIVFLIDEYEYLFIEAFDTPVSFMKLRSLSTEINDKGEAIFNFWLVGSTTWDELCAAVPGSGEANTISSTEWVVPLNENSFTQMWKFECDKIEDKELKSFLISKKEFAYIASGGVPYYGKVIGSYLLKERKDPEYTICNPSFKELTSKTMNLGEFYILKKLAINPQKIEKSIHRSILINKGIIKSDNKERLSISIGFLKDYIIAQINDNKIKNSYITEIESLYSSIIILIETINKQRQNYKQVPLFKAVLDSASLETDLRTPCRSAEQFGLFTLALYKIYFERTKDSRNDLNKQFFLSSDFGKCVDIARHSYGKAHEMDNFTQREGQYSRTDMLKSMLGTLDEPYTPSEWTNLQISFLNKFKSELNEIFNFIKQSYKRNNK